MFIHRPINPQLRRCAPANPSTDKTFSSSGKVPKDDSGTFRQARGTKTCHGHTLLMLLTITLITASGSEVEIRDAKKLWSQLPESIRQEYTPTKWGELKSGKTAFVIGVTSNVNDGIKKVAKFLRNEKYYNEWKAEQNFASDNKGKHFKHLTRIFESSDKCIIMEHGGESLQSMVLHGSLTPIDYVSAIWSVFKAKRELGELNLEHCDLCPGNILRRKVNDTYIYKVTDFGTLTKVDDLTNYKHRERAPDIPLKMLLPDLLQASCKTEVTVGRVLASPKQHMGEYGDTHGMYAGGIALTEHGRDIKTSF